MLEIWGQTRADQACAAEVDRLRPGPVCSGGLLEQAFAGGLAAEAAVGPMVVAGVLPFGEFVVEELGMAVFWFSRS
jgi:hypothetical protein